MINQHKTQFKSQYGNILFSSVIASNHDVNLQGILDYSTPLSRAENPGISYSHKNSLASSLIDSNYTLPQMTGKDVEDFLAKYLQKYTKNATNADQCTEDSINAPKQFDKTNRPGNDLLKSLIVSKEIPAAHPKSTLICHSNLTDQLNRAVSPSFPAADAPSLCPICLEALPNLPDSLWHHMMRRHPAFSCRACDATFPDLNLLREHVFSRHIEANHHSSSDAAVKKRLRKISLHFNRTIQRHLSEANVAAPSRTSPIPSLPSHSTAQKHHKLSNLIKTLQIPLPNLEQISSQSQQLFITKTAQKSRKNECSKKMDASTNTETASDEFAQFSQSEATLKKRNHDVNDDDDDKLEKLQNNGKADEKELEVEERKDKGGGEGGAARRNNGSNSCDVIFACPIPDCESRHKTREEFNAHFLRHFMGELPGDINSLIPDDPPIPIVDSKGFDLPSMTFEANVVAAAELTTPGNVGSSNLVEALDLFPDWLLPGELKSSANHHLPPPPPASHFQQHKEQNSQSEEREEASESLEKKQMSTLESDNAREKETEQRKKSEEKEVEKQREVERERQEDNIEKNEEEDEAAEFFKTHCHDLTSALTLPAEYEPARKRARPPDHCKHLTHHHHHPQQHHPQQNHHLKNNHHHSQHSHNHHHHHQKQNPHHHHHHHHHQSHNHQNKPQQESRTARLRNSHSHTHTQPGRSCSRTCPALNKSWADLTRRRKQILRQPPGFNHNSNQLDRLILSTDARRKWQLPSKYETSNSTATASFVCN